MLLPYGSYKPPDLMVVVLGAVQETNHLPTTVEATKLEDDCAPTPKA